MSNCINFNSMLALMTCGIFGSDDDDYYNYYKGKSFTPDKSANDSNSKGKTLTSEISGENIASPAHKNIRVEEERFMEKAVKKDLGSDLLSHRSLEHNSPDEGTEWDSQHPSLPRTRSNVSEISMYSTSSRLTALTDRTDATLKRNEESNWHYSGRSDTGSNTGSDF